jgi:hypothetical protein
MHRTPGTVAATKSGGAGTLAGNLDRIVFSTDAFPERERFSAFCEEIVRRFSGLDLRTEDQSRFHANLELRRAGAVDIATNHSVAVNSVRTPGFVRDGDDALIVMLLRGGSAIQTQCGDRHQLEPGQAVICDYGYSGEFNLVTDSSFLSLKIPRQKLSVLLPHMSRFAGAKLDRDPVALRLLSAYLAGTLNVDLNGSAQAAQLHQDHIVDLVALALGTNGEAREVAEARGAQGVRRAGHHPGNRNSFRRSGDRCLGRRRAARHHGALCSPFAGADRPHFLRASARPPAGAGRRTVARPLT